LGYQRVALGEREQSHRNFPTRGPRGPTFGPSRRALQRYGPGTKAPESSVWLGVPNHADMDKVRSQFAAMLWQMPSAVQLMLTDQEECFFRLSMIRDGQFCQVSLPAIYETADKFWPTHESERLGRLLHRLITPLDRARVGDQQECHMVDWTTHTEIQYRRVKPSSVWRTSSSIPPAFSIVLAEAALLSSHVTRSRSSPSC
jgi:hypothetical protein